jgi:molybdopterin molybdotransferase
MTENDVVVLAGGISRGDYDLVRAVFEENSIKLLFERAGSAPGRPVLLGVSDAAVCFGLSGSPVSNFVMFELMVKPFLYALAGHRFRPVTTCGELVGPLRKRWRDKDRWFPVTATPDGRIRPVEGQRSTGIIAMCQAHGLVHVPAGVAGFTEGSVVVVRWL